MINTEAFYPVVGMGWANCEPFVRHYDGRAALDVARRGRLEICTCRRGRRLRRRPRHHHHLRRRRRRSAVPFQNCILCPAIEIRPSALT